MVAYWKNWLFFWKCFIFVPKFSEKVPWVSEGFFSFFLSANCKRAKEEKPLAPRVPKRLFLFTYYTQGKGVSAEFYNIYTIPFSFFDQIREET